MPADAGMVSGAVDRPCGYARYATQLSSAIDLDTAPTQGKRLSTTKGDANRALFVCETQDVRWTDDPDITLSATVGMLLPKGVYFEYSGDLSKIKFMEAAATAVLNVHYYNS